MKSELIEKIVLSLTNIIEDVDMGELKSRLYIAMKGYDISLESTEIVVREENKNEWLFKRFIVTKTVKGLSPKSLQLYSKTIPKILEYIGKPIQEITSDDIIQYLAIREYKDRVSKTTCANESRYLSSFFDFMAAEGYITSNPVRRLGTIKVEKKKKNAFTDIEVAKIRNSCEGLKEKTIVEMLLSTGCRVSELVSIKIKDIQDRKIIVNGKGNKERTVYLNASALLILDEYMKTMAKTSNPYLFPKIKSCEKLARKGMSLQEFHKTSYMNVENVESDGYMPKSSVESMCRRIGERAGVDCVYPHKFRRTCATMALKRGMPIEQVSKLLGHEQLGTTQIYLDLNERDLELAHEKYVL